MLRVNLGKLPIPASKLENAVRTHCTHYGYHDAHVELNTKDGSLELLIRDPQPITSLESFQHPGTVPSVTKETPKLMC